MFHKITAFSQTVVVVARAPECFLAKGSLKKEYGTDFGSYRYIRIRCTI